MNAPFRLVARLIAALLVTLLPLQPAQAEAVPLRPALWKVADADTTIYLFGTIHMLRPGADWLHGPLAQALDSSDELLTEVVDASGAQTQAALLKRALLPQGKSLRTLLPPADRTAFGTLLHRIPVADDTFDRYKPWYASVALASLPLLQRGYTVRDGVEAALDAHAASRPHIRAGLETVDQQLALLDGLPRKTQLAYLRTVIAQYDRISPDVDAMFDAWGKGDAEELATLINADEGKDDPLLTETLILRRNRTWAGWVRQRLHQPGVVFVAVGAGHLAGRGSVQDVLARKGIMAERVQ